MKIIATIHNRLPIPLRASDWIALYDDDPNCIAFAATEREAIDALTKRFPYYYGEEWL